MQVRIQNDSGLGYSTRISDAETGKLLEHVYKVTINIDVSKRLLAVIYTYMHDIDVIADAEIRKVCPCCGKEKLEDEDKPFDLDQGL